MLYNRLQAAVLLALVMLDGKILAADRESYARSCVDMSVPEAQILPTISTNCDACSAFLLAQWAINAIANFHRRKLLLACLSIIRIFKIQTLTIDRM